MLSLLLNACSSLPKQRIINNPVQEQALQLSEKASQFEKIKAWDKALTYYQYALEKYRLTDDVQGVLATQISIARQYKQMNQKSDYDNICQKIESTLSISTGKNDLANEFTLLKIEYLYQLSEYDSLLSVFQSIQEENQEHSLRKHSWEYLSLFETNKNFKSKTEALESEADKALKAYKKKQFENISAISFAYYTLGYVAYHQRNASQTDYQKSIRYFQKAYEADVIDQNFHNLATDLYYFASAYQKMNDHKNAAWYFERAGHVYKQCNDQEKSDFAFFFAYKNQYLQQKRDEDLQIINQLLKKTENTELVRLIEEWLKTIK